ncbi:MAG: M23 family metallopeptidase, partial [Caldilineaceae bacterium]|nr:M23 family metallopeptidase [Caldilineaceae bacterium]
MQSRIMGLVVLITVIGFALYETPYSYAQQPSATTTARPNMDGDVHAQPAVLENSTVFSKLPVGQRPFLSSKPFTETEQSRIDLNSFFDHRLPIYENEMASNLPFDLRDVDQITTTIFLGEDRISEQGQGYGWYSGHNGLDYGLTRNVLAAADGRIAYTGRSAITDNFCNVWIEHENSVPADDNPDYSTRYLHLSSLGDAPATERTRPGRICGTAARWCRGDSIHAGDIIG